MSRLQNFSILNTFINHKYVHTFDMKLFKQFRKILIKILVNSYELVLGI